MWIEVLTPIKDVEMKAESTDAVLRMMENALADYACESGCPQTVEYDVSHGLTGTAV